MSILPPKYINVPVEMVYTDAIPPALRDTWIQLRGLAWQNDETPELKASELANILSKSESTVYGHLSRLHNYSLLLLEKTATGKIRVSFDPSDDYSRILETVNSIKTQELEVTKANNKNKNTKDDHKDYSYHHRHKKAKVCY